MGFIDIEANVLKPLKEGCVSGFLKWAIVIVLMCAVGLAGLMVGLHLSGNLTPQQDVKYPNIGVTAFQNGNKLPSSLNVLGTAILATNDKMQDAVADMAEGVKDVVHDTAEAVTDVANGLTDAVHDIGDTVADMAGDVVDASIANVVDTASDILSDVADNVADIPEEFLVNIDDVDKDVSDDVIDDFLDDTDDFIDDILDDREDVMDDILDDREDVMEDILDDREDVMDDILDDREDFMDDFLDDREDVLDDILDDRQDVIDDILDDREDVIDDILDDKEDVLDDILDEREDVIDDILDDREDVMDDVLDDVLDDTEFVFGDILDDLSDTDNDVNDDDSLHSIEEGIDNGGDQDDDDKDIRLTELLQKLTVLGKRVSKETSKGDSDSSEEVVEEKDEIDDLIKETFEESESSEEMSTDDPSTLIAISSNGGGLNSFGKTNDEDLGKDDSVGAMDMMFMSLLSANNPTPQVGNHPVHVSTSKVNQYSSTGSSQNAGSPGLKHGQNLERLKRGLISLSRLSVQKPTSKESKTPLPISTPTVNPYSNTGQNTGNSGLKYGTHLEHLKRRLLSLSRLRAQKPTTKGSNTPLPISSLNVNPYSNADISRNTQSSGLKLVHMWSAIDF